tara:strand:- start:24 stop:254 length:231 start_codon:yes stop_codon:yes gene_type:complete
MKKADYKHHMMYPPDGGPGRMTKSYEEHLKLKNKGWMHKKGKKDKKGKSTGAKMLKKKIVSKKAKKKPKSSGGYGY